MLRTSWISLTLIVSFFFASTRPASAAEPLADKVREAIDKGVGYLKKKQENRGGEWNWENAELLNAAWAGGTSSLATLALLNSGVKPNDPAVSRVLPYIRSLKPTQTYVTALQSMVLAEVGEVKDLDILQRNTTFLLDSRIYANKDLMGWSYGKGGHLQADNSNTQYALLGLLAARQAGVKIAEKDWKEIQDFYIRTQVKTDAKSGGWPYRPAVGEHPTHTMTVAGLAGLYIAGLELNMGKQKLDTKTGVAENCGKYDENEAIARGMQWLEKHFRFDMSDHVHKATFYNVYGIERVGRLSGQRFIGSHDWYREGCELLCGLSKPVSPLQQGEDGSWRLGTGIDNMPVISTSFALLFLSKGRTPILISKLAFDAQGSTTDWNRKHHDVRNLVDYASANLYKKQPLGWQIFDPRQADVGTEERMNEELSGLLQAPILYLNGHKAPSMTPQQVKLIRRFVDEGGFIFAEACCGSVEFKQGFTKLMEQVFNFDDKGQKINNGSPLTPLKPDHPVWTSHMPINSGEFMAGRKEADWIQCVERGCKTVAIFTPQPLAGFWEERQFIPANNLPPTKRSDYAYRFAGNVIAYATGLEMPKPKLSKIELTDRRDASNVTRHTLKLAQLSYGSDSKPAPQAMRVLAGHLQEHFKLDVAALTDSQEIRPGRLAELLQHKFMYLHGRREFKFDDEDIRNIRSNLRTGGTLFADACCGSREFDKSFRELAAKLYPQQKMERIPLDDFLYSDKLNGRQISTVKCRKEKADGTPATEYEDTAPEFEGVKVNGRWAIIYSKYDIGCALEKAKSSACKGHDHESAKVLAAAAVLYSLKR